MTYRLPGPYSPASPGCCDHCQHDDVLLVRHDGPCKRCTGELPDNRLHARVVAVRVAGSMSAA